MTEILERHHLEPQTGLGLELRRGQILRVIDPQGEQVADLLAFNAADRREWLSSGRSIDYNDTIYRHGVAGAPRNRAAHARELLVGRWDGYGRAGSPEVWLTEGGADLRAKLVAGDRRKQADLVRENWDRMADAQGDGAGIGMVTNYLGYSAPNFDTGLRDPLDAGGASRPVEATWRRLRSRP